MAELDLSAIQPFFDQARSSLSENGCIVLFGSRARGDAGPDGDFDLALIDGPLSKDLEARPRLREQAREAKGLVQLQFYSPDEFEGLFRAQILRAKRDSWWIRNTDEWVMELHIAFIGKCLAGDGSRFDLWQSEVQAEIAEGSLPLTNFQNSIDLRDGLLEQERTLFAQAQRFLTSEERLRKTSFLLGQCTAPIRGRSHYWFSKCIEASLRHDLARFPLFFGRGNFGSIYGDPSAAHRYTELRANPALSYHGQWQTDTLKSRHYLSRRPLLELDEDPFERYGDDRPRWSIRGNLEDRRRRIERYQAEIEELERALKEQASESKKPSEGKKKAAPVYPFGPPPREETLTLFPHRLVNGSSGLEPVPGGVGIRGSFPSHTLGGVIAALLEIVQDEQVSDELLLDRIGLPDFARGGCMTDPEAARSAQASGRGSIEIEAVFESCDRDGIPILALRELPPSLSIQTVLAELREERKNDRFQEIEGIENHSTQVSNRIEFQLSSKADAVETRDRLLDATSLRSVFPVDMLGDEDGSESRTSVPDLLRRACAYHLESLGDSTSVADSLQYLRRFADPRRTRIRGE